MKAKKRDRTVSEEPKQLSESAQTDHELFLQAFEKPTQIYRFLRTRHAFLPIFLNRNARYMMAGCKRKANSAPRMAPDIGIDVAVKRFMAQCSLYWLESDLTGFGKRFFKVDSLLAKAEGEYKKLQVNSYKSEYLNLTFNSIQKGDNSDLKSVDVEVLLVKICHMKRKDTTTPETEVSIGRVTVPLNTSSVDPMIAESLSIPSDCFCLNGSQTVKSYRLRFVVTSSRKPNGTSTPRPTTRSRESNSSDLENQDPPPKKRLRRSSEEKPLKDGKQRGDRTKSQCENILYQTDLMIYDKQKRCLLEDGDYEVLLEEIGSNLPISTGKRSTWETVSEDKDALMADIFGKRPVIRFSLCWNQSSLQHATSLSSSSSCDDIVGKNHTGGQTFQVKTAGLQEKLTQREPAGPVSPTKRPKRIFYQFLFNNNTRQQTEARDDCRCPWCRVNCVRLPSLLAHLRCNHARFNFSYVEHPKGARIDVSINECYDGSYVGNPQDLHSHVGLAFSRDGPVRRLPVTLVLVYRSKKFAGGPNELQDSESDSVTRHTIHGHNRLYFHSSTCMPIRPCEIDMDSEDENDPEWLRQKTQHMIDEFTDVNEGEKELMKLWNLHVMNHNYIGDCQMKTACESFVKEHGPEIVRKNLGRNFILHLVNLYDFGLIRPEIVYRIAVQFFRLRRQLEDSGASTPTETASTEIVLTSTEVASTSNEIASTKYEPTTSNESASNKCEPTTSHEIASTTFEPTSTS